MKDNYDTLNDTFNTDDTIDVEIQNVKEGGCAKRKDHLTNITNDIDKDYNYTRGQLYSLIEKMPWVLFGGNNISANLKNKPNLKILISGFGVGYSWASAIVNLNNPKYCALNKI